MLNRLQDVFRSFQHHDVRYVVIGGIAVILHGVPRATFDLDILIEATPDNAKRLINALIDAGLATASMTTIQELLSNEITIFKDRVRIDVQTSIPGIQFPDAWKRREIMAYQGQEFFVLSKADLVVTKRAAGRDVDLEDARLLELPETHENAEQSDPGDV
ncbi:MAG: nucleotidyltransferase [Candidatus Aureabacteria bacterium]|nr:nucleotidyltransferase [Candidatus Auribacterota bacterium]